MPAEGVRDGGVRLAGCRCGRGQPRQAGVRILVVTEFLSEPRAQCRQLVGFDAVLARRAVQRLEAAFDLCQALRVKLEIFERVAQLFVERRIDARWDAIE